MKSPRQQYFFHIARIFIVHSFIGCFSVLFKTIINIIYNKEWHSIQKIIFGLFLLEECFKYLDVYKYTFVKHSYHKQFFLPFSSSIHVTFQYFAQKSFKRPKSIPTLCSCACTQCSQLKSAGVNQDTSVSKTVVIYGLGWVGPGQDLNFPSLQVDCICTFL